MPNDILTNPYRRLGMPPAAELAAGEISVDPTAALALLGRCPVAAVTPLRELPALAAALDIGALFLKDESERMGFGSFKALGAAYAIACEASQRSSDIDCAAVRKTALAGVRYICASAGNHGLSVAAAARLFGATAEIYLSTSVPESFAESLRRLGAAVIRAGENYEESMVAAQTAAQADSAAVLLADSSWPGYTALPAKVMEGYLVMGAEVAKQLVTPPDFIFLQAGVGGMAAAMAAYFRTTYGDAPVIVVVEPSLAPALIGSIRAGKPVAATGGVSNMGRLDCKEPSHLALAALAHDADFFVTVDDRQSHEAVALLKEHGIATTPSGAAGVAAMGACYAELGMLPNSRVLAFISEGARA